MFSFIILCSILVILTVTLITLAYYIYVKSTTGVCVSSRHLVGKVVVVTGGTSGIGYETAADLAERGARVLVASNEPHGAAVAAAIAARAGHGDVHFIHLDLASLRSVRAVAGHILKTEQRLDVLINNAGVFLAKPGLTEDGLPIGMQIDYFGPFLLTNLLLPLMIQTGSARIVNVSSKSKRFGRVDLEKLKEPRNGCFSSFLTYCDSKLCVALITVELSRRLRGTGVTANSLHPGSSLTNMMRHDSFLRQLFLRILLIKYFIKAPREAAQTSIHLAVSAEVENTSGCYFKSCRKVKDPGKIIDENLAKQLWLASNEITSLPV